MLCCDFDTSIYLIYFDLGFDPCIDNILFGLSSLINKYMF